MSKSTVHIRRPYDPRERVFLKTGSETFVQQASKQETDINWIMAKYQKTGVVEHLARFGAAYEDLMDAPGYHEAMNRLLAAQEAFESLPSTVRRHFDNDPERFLAAVDDPERVDELRELGLYPRDEVPRGEPLPAGEAGGDPASQGSETGGAGA